MIEGAKIRLTSSATHPYAHMSEAGVGLASSEINNSGLMYRKVAPNGDGRVSSPSSSLTRDWSCGSRERPKSQSIARSSAVTRTLC